MNAMDLRHSRMNGWELADAMDRNLDRHRRQVAVRDEAEHPTARQQAFLALVETERERRSLEAEMRSRGISPPTGGRGKSSSRFLRRHRERPGRPVNERRVPIVGYREVSVDDDRITVLAVVTAAEDGVWRSDLMRLDPGTAAEIQAGLTGEDPIRVMDRMYRERSETSGVNPTPEGEERRDAP